MRKIFEITKQELNGHLTPIASFFFFEEAREWAFKNVLGFHVAEKKENASFRPKTPFELKCDRMKIEDIEVDGIDTRDAPDFCDAFICSASWSDGTDLTQDELDELNEDGDFIYAQVENHLY